LWARMHLSTKARQTDDQMTTIAAEIATQNWER